MPYWTAGCLFDLVNDAPEQHDLAADPAHALTLRSMHTELTELNKAIFSPDRGAEDIASCTQAAKYGGFWGPFVFP
jgi:hypothetical protein